MRASSFLSLLKKRQCKVIANGLNFSKQMPRKYQNISGTEVLILKKKVNGEDYFISTFVDENPLQICFKTSAYKDGQYPSYNSTISLTVNQVANVILSLIDDIDRGCI